MPREEDSVHSEGLELRELDPHTGWKLVKNLHKEGRAHEHRTQATKNGKLDVSLQS